MVMHVGGSGHTAGTRRTVTSCAMSEALGAGRRDDDQLARDVSAWGAHHFSMPSWRVAHLARPSSGWANETVIITVSGVGDGGPEDDRLVVRMPPLTPVFPACDLGAQARVLEALATEPVLVPRVVAHEEEEHWIGAPFLVMSFEQGRAGPEAPAVDPWLLGAPVDRQVHLHRAFVEMLATLHRVDWRDHDLGEVLRGADASFASEVRWWVDYVSWATDGSPPPLLADVAAWCAETAPQADGPCLCWGDARIGNVLYSDDFGMQAVLDWELASIGPPEMDIGWYLVLEDVVESFTGRRVPGFMRRDDVIACYEQFSGRRLGDVEWHELFALTRSVAISERLSIVAALGGGRYPGGGGNDSPVLRDLVRRIDAYVGGSAH